MDNKFDLLFNLTDSDDVHYHNVIPNCDIIPMLDLLREWVLCIQTHQFESENDLNWFHNALLECNANELIDWTIKAPALFDLKWEILTSAKICFIALMLLENTDIKCKKSLWELFPRP